MEVVKVDEFKHLSQVVKVMERVAEVKKIVQGGWNEWGRVTGMICDIMVSVTKGKAYKTV